MARAKLDPTHFYCLDSGCLNSAAPYSKSRDQGHEAWSGQMPISAWYIHMSEVHPDEDAVPVQLAQRYCVHGNPVADWSFCCDYDPW